MKLLMLISGFLFIWLTGQTQNSGTFIDERDNQTYNWIKIGNQTWMAENLNYDAGDGSICYAEEEHNCEKYGRLYTWEIAKDVCPDGWHLPSDNEWKKLEEHLGMNSQILNKTKWRGKKAGLKLKADKGWENKGGGSNLSGFNALPGGFYMSVPKKLRSVYDRFLLLNKIAYYWTSKSADNKIWTRALRHDKKGVNRSLYDTEKLNDLGLSVRCIKD